MPSCAHVARTSSRLFVQVICHSNIYASKTWHARFLNIQQISSNSRADPDCTTDWTRAQNNSSEDNAPATCRVKGFSRPQMPLDLAPGVE